MIGAAEINDGFGNAAAGSNTFSPTSCLGSNTDSDTGISLGVSAPTLVLGSEAASTLPRRSNRVVSAPTLVLGSLAGFTGS